MKVCIALNGIVNDYNKYSSRFREDLWRRKVPAVENVVVKLRCWDSEASVIWNVAGASFNM